MHFRRSLIACPLKKGKQDFSLTRVKTFFKKMCVLIHTGNALANGLACWLVQLVQDLEPAGVTVFCSWTRHFTLTVPLCIHGSLNGYWQFQMLRVGPSCSTLSMLLKPQLHVRAESCTTLDSCQPDFFQVYRNFV